VEFEVRRHAGNLQQQSSRNTTKYKALKKSE
jgi:hypothetical protein